MWTSIYIEDSLADALPRLHAQGWRYCELSCEHLGKLAETSREPGVIQQVQSVLDALGMQMPQAHLFLQANIASSDEEKRYADLTRVLNELEVCAELGVRNAVIHPGGDASDELRSLRVNQFKILAERAEKVQVRIAIENMMDGKDVLRYGSRIGELHELIDAVGSDMLGICFDTSHANVQKLDIPAAVRECGDRLIATHISDNDGSGDQHKTPGYARIDWVPVVQAMHEMGYDGVFNLEIPGERGCPPGILDLKVHHAYEVTAWLLAH